METSSTYEIIFIYIYKILDIAYNLIFFRAEFVSCLEFEPSIPIRQSPFFRIWYLKFSAFKEQRWILKREKFGQYCGKYMGYNMQ